jgi:raffinose/stachyose/melibiose transport system substrate-binding protein
VEGTLYSLSGELETMVVWYNKTLFEEHGWQVPTTMDELFALGESVREAGLIPFAPAFGEFPSGIQWYFGVFLSHYAGADKVYEALTGQREWTDPAFVEAITKFNEIVQEGWFMGSMDLYFTDTFDTAHALFGNGDIAMNIEGTWFQESINQYFGEAAGNENEWDWFPIPTTFSKDPFYIIGVGSSWGLNAQSDVLDAAAEVLDFYFSPQAQSAFFDCGQAPAPLVYEGNAFANADPRIAAIFESFGQASAAGNYGYTNWTFWPAKTNVWMFEGLAQVHTGQITVEDYLARMQTEFEAEFNEGLVPPIPAR